MLCFSGNEKSRLRQCDLKWKFCLSLSNSILYPDFWSKSLTNAGNKYPFVETKADLNAVTLGSHAKSESIPLLQTGPAPGHSKLITPSPVFCKHWRKRSSHLPSSECGLRWTKRSKALRHVHSQKPCVHWANARLGESQHCSFIAVAEKLEEQLSVGLAKGRCPTHP